MSLRFGHLFLTWFALTGALACKPSVGQPPSLITEPTLIAVWGEPPEVRPGATVTYSFLIASPQGTVSAPGLWSVCLAPKPPAEGNSVSSACVGVPDGGAIASGATFVTAVPTKACQLFGPIAPPPVPGQSAVRPRDPDSTGGFYLPVETVVAGLSADPLVGFAFERITCNLPNARADIVQQYNARYVPNVDPGIDHTDLVDPVGTTLSLDAGTQTIPAGAVLTVRTTFVPGSAEIFPVYDSLTETLVNQQEIMSVSWFVTGGTFVNQRTGVAAGENAASTSNEWTAPKSPGLYFLWVVLRDSRGGLAYKSYQMQVSP